MDEIKTPGQMRLVAEIIEMVHDGCIGILVLGKFADPADPADNDKKATVYEIAGTLACATKNDVIWQDEQPEEFQALRDRYQAEL